LTGTLNFCTEKCRAIRRGPRKERRRRGEGGELFSVLLATDIRPNELSTAGDALIYLFMALLFTFFFKKYLKTPPQKKKKKKKKRKRKKKYFMETQNTYFTMPKNI
jgi:hypothetical protein